MTLKQQYEKALKKLGYQMLEGNSYRSKWANDGTMAGYIFIGSHGSVRIGRSRSVSIPISEGRKQCLLSVDIKGVKLDY